MLPERDHHVISGALLPFSSEATVLLLSGLRDALKLKKRDKLRLTPEQLSGCAPIFTAAWLFTEIARVLDPAVPDLFNSDGDEVIFHDLRFPFATGVTQKQVAAGLDRVKALLPEGPKFWNWTAMREKVVEWLKYLENGNARREGGASAEYDFGWMWAELGLEGYRK